MPKPVYLKKPRKAYCNVNPLKCCEFPDLRKGLGLTFGEEFTHQGLNKQMVDCEYETVTVNTKSAGGPKFVEEVNEEREKVTHFIIRDIDRVIEELQEHRRRLLGDLEESK